MIEDTLVPDGYEYYEAMKRRLGCSSCLYVDINVGDGSILPTVKDKNHRDKLMEFGLKHNFKMYVGTKLVDEDVLVGTKTYKTSSTNKQFRLDQVDPDMEFIRVMYDWGSDEEMRQEEYELLSKYRTNNKPLFYNKNNGRPGKKKVNYELVDILKQELNWLRSGQQPPKGKKFKYLGEHLLRGPKIVSEINQWDITQTRSESIDRKNINKIKDRIDMEGGKPSPNAKAVVVLLDREYASDGKNKRWFKVLIISGNHTITAYMEFDEYMDSSTLNYIVIPPSVHKLLSDADVNELSNSMNEETAIEKPFDKFDAVKACKDLLGRARSWNTQAVRKSFIQKGLTRQNVKWVFDQVMEDIRKDKALKNLGKVTPDYREKGRDRDLLDKECKLHDDGETFIYKSSLASIKPNDVLVGKAPSKKTPVPTGFHHHNLWRKANGQKPYNKIKVVGYCNTQKIEDIWLKELKPQFEIMWNMANGNYPMIEYIVMDREIDQTIYKEKKEKI